MGTSFFHYFSTLKKPTFKSYPLPQRTVCTLVKMMIIMVDPLVVIATFVGCFEVVVIVVDDDGDVVDTMASFELTSSDPCSITADTLVVIATFLGRFDVVDDDDDVGDTMVSFELTSSDPCSITADTLVVIATFVGRFDVDGDGDDDVVDTMVSSG